MTASLEKYLKTIYILIERSSTARVTDIAKELNCSKASVNRALKLLKDKKLIEYESYGTIELTEKGTSLAKVISKKQDTIKEFLSEVLELDHDIAEKEADKMKHAASEDTADKLKLYLQNLKEFRESRCEHDIANRRCRMCIKTSKRYKF